MMDSKQRAGIIAALVSKGLSPADAEQGLDVALQASRECIETLLRITGYASSPLIKLTAIQVAGFIISQKLNSLPDFIRALDATGAAVTRVDPAPAT